MSHARWPRRLAVLISGRGSNLQSIMDAVDRGDVDATIGVVVSNRSDALGLKRAEDAGLKTVHLSPRDYPDRESYDSALADVCRSYDIGLICLAGFMRVIGRRLLDGFPHRVLNVHPSLLPSFPGLNAQRQALEYGVRISGATVHLVDDQLDGGPIVLQAAVPVRDDDTADSLAARILMEEHRLYPEAIRMILDGDWSIVGRRVVRAMPQP
jgi:phosphoribosylglycinamide formyltransferase 1